jgi:hypothetical protein
LILLAVILTAHAKPKNLGIASSPSRKQPDVQTIRDFFYMPFPSFLCPRAGSVVIRGAGVFLLDKTPGRVKSDHLW